MPAIALRGESYDVTREQVLDVLSLSIDSEIFENASILIFKTAKLIYGVDYHASLPEKLDLFEEYLEKILGSARCNRIMDHAFSELEGYRIDRTKGIVKCGGDGID
jgi:hypothetical protein